MLKEKVKALIAENESKLISRRRELHNYPELSSQEHQTVAYLKKELAHLNLETYDVKNSTGFYMIFDTQKAGQTIGLRTDIDALPVNEPKMNLKQERTCHSKNPGVMHACGHDGHMATLITAIEILVALKEYLSGKLVFIFEEGEETHSGILPMIDALKEIKFDAIYGAHLLANLETGKVGLDSGSVMSGLARIAFDVIGKGGHGSRPDLSINPIYATANILTNLASAWVNQLDVTKTVTLGITQVIGGEALNVFPEKVFVGGTLRFFDVAAGEKGLEVLKKITSQIAKAHNCQIAFHDNMELALLPVVNDEKLAEIAKKAALDIFPEIEIIPGANWFASETFTHYQKLAPTCFALVGTKNEELGSGAEHHNQFFDLDEASLKYNLGIMVMFVLTLMNR